MTAWLIFAYHPVSSGGISLMTAWLIFVYHPVSSCRISLMTAWLISVYQLVSSCRISLMTSWLIFAYHPVSGKYHRTEAEERKGKKTTHTQKQKTKQWNSTEMNLKWNEESPDNDDAVWHFVLAFCTWVTVVLIRTAECRTSAFQTFIRPNLKGKTCVLMENCFLEVWESKLLQEYR